MPSANWILNGSSNWSLASNWSPAVPAEGAGFTATFAINITTSNKTITLDRAFTIGNLVFQDTTPNVSYILAGNALTLDNSGSSASINSISTGFGGYIDCPVIGSVGFTKTGAGILSLRSQNNTALTGPIVINGGQFEANSNAVSSANLANPGTESGIAGASSLSVLSGLAYIGNANLTVAYPIAISDGATAYAGGFNQTGTYLQDITGEITGEGTLALWTFGSNFNRPVINRVRSSTLPATLRMMTYSGVGDYRPVYYYYSGSGNPNTVDLIVDLNQTTTMEQPTTTMYVHNVSPTAGVLTFRDVIKSASNAAGIPDLVTLNIGVVGAASGVTDTGDIVITRDVYEAAGNAALSINKGGPRKLILTGNNTYTGTTTISGGVLSAQSNSALGSPSTGVVSILSGASLEISGGVNLNKGNQSFTIASNGSVPSLTSPAGINSIICAGITLSQNILVDISSNSSLSLNNTGAIIGTNVGIVKNGDGELILSTASNTFTGNITINGGDLTVGSISSAGSPSSWGAGSGTINIPGALKINGTGGSTTRTINLAGTTTTIDSSGSNPVSFSSVTQSSGYRVVVLDGTNAGNNTISAPIGNGSVGSSTQIAKNGSGKWKLTGALTYTGITEVNEGTLNIGSISQTFANDVILSAGTRLEADSGGSCSGAVYCTGAQIYTPLNTFSVTLNGTSEIGSLLSGNGSLYVNAGTTTIESESTNTYSGTSTVSSGSTVVARALQNPSSLSTGKVFGDSNLLMGGTLYTASTGNQQGKLRYGGSVTFGTGAQIHIGGA